MMMNPIHHIKLYIYIYILTRRTVRTIYAMDWLLINMGIGQPQQQRTHSPSDSSQIPPNQNPFAFFIAPTLIYHTICLHKQFEYVFLGFGCCCCWCWCWGYMHGYRPWKATKKKLIQGLLESPNCLIYVFTAILAEFCRNYIFFR